MIKFIFWIGWTEKSLYDSTSDMHFGKFIKVYSTGLGDAHTKAENWIKKNNLQNATIQKFEALSEIEKVY